MNKNLALVGVSFVLFIILSSLVFAIVPPLPMEIYGSAKAFNVPSSPGTKIIAYDPRGEVCGEFDVVHRGYFGLLSCLGENTIENVSGASINELIRFRVGTYPASVVAWNTSNVTDLLWESGSFKQIALVVPPLVCGDGFCDSLENCNSCVEDCGECREGSGQTGESGPSSPTPSFDFGDMFPPERPFNEEIEEDCIESWSCSDWSFCLPSGFQTRECVDVNQCGTEENKPVTEQECIFTDYEAEDSIHRTERPRVEAPLVIEKCNERMSFFSFGSLLFVLIFALVVLIPLFYLHYKKKIIRKKKIDEIDKLILIYHLERKIYTFLIIVSVLAVIIYLYHYFFFLCTDVYYNNLWLLIAFILLSPIVINVLLVFLSYSEKHKLFLINLLNDTHYKHLKYLITVYNKDLLKSEVEITNKIYSLNNKEDFSDLLFNTKEIKKIYDDLLKLYALYSEGEDSLKIEQDLLKQIESLDKNEAFNKAVLDHPEFASLKDNISLLYKAYQGKKDLLDELFKLEKQIKDRLVKQKNNVLFDGEGSDEDLDVDSGDDSVIDSEKFKGGVEDIGASTKLENETSKKEGANSDYVAGSNKEHNDVNNVNDVNDVNDVDGVKESDESDESIESDGQKKHLGDKKSNLGEEKGDAESWFVEKK